MATSTYCRSRRDIERDYYRDWERSTLIDEEELNRPMTIWTFMRFLPVWARFYALPGPLRYVLYLVWRQAAFVGLRIRKHFVLQGAKLDAHLMQRSGMPTNTFSRRLIMLRFHNRISPGENIKYRLGLVRGTAYSPRIEPKPEAELYHVREKLDPAEYDPTSDPWPAN